ncbi:MAG: hypothetical protein M3203_01155 [Actinomycetota bacterium]|nr:hypothetical protein [Actinomycetota bacterium]
MIPGVQLVRVETDGPEITADVFGGEEPVVMAEVVFRTDDSNEHQRLVRTFAKWEDQGTPLTLVHGEDGVVTLLDEDSVLQ